MWYFLFVGSEFNHPSKITKSVALIHQRYLSVYKLSAQRVVKWNLVKSYLILEIHVSDIWFCIPHYFKSLAFEVKKRMTCT